MTLFAAFAIFVPALLAAASAAPGIPRLALVRELPADSTRSDVAAAVLPLADGALVTGWTSVAGGPARGLILRIDPGGGVRWRRETGGEGAGLLFAALADGESAFVCAGFRVRDGRSDGWIVRLAADGSTLWERRVGGETDERLTAIQAVPGGWLAAGQTGGAADVDAWVVRLDREGREVGTWTWGGPGVQRALSVTPLDDGGCLIAGRVGEGRGEVDGFVTRLSAAGREVWSRTVGGPGFQVAYQVRPGPDGVFLVTGYAYADAARDHDGFVLRVDGAGRVRERRDLGGSGYDRATQSVAMDDGSIVTIGYTKRPGAADRDPAWQTVLYGSGADGGSPWSLRVGAEGLESGHAIARAGDVVWAVGQSSPPSGGSRVLVVRLDTREAPPAPVHH